MPQKQREESYETDKAEAKYIHSQNNNNNNKCNKSDHLTVERDRNMRQTFNYEQRVDSVTCDAPSAAIKTRRRKNANANANVSKQSANGGPPISQCSYENLKFDLDLSKRLLLHRYFRSTEKACGGGDYENLCRGCGYGVFEARGHLCNFCECIVNGVKAVRSASDECDDASANIYENVCDKCARIYAGTECACTIDCGAAKTVDSTDNAKDSSGAIDKQVYNDRSAELIPRVKAQKCNRDKRNIFQDLLGSLKRVRSPQHSRAQTSTIPAAGTGTSAIADAVLPCTRQRLQIVHNVDGYDKVFRTQDTFDLQRICELKRTQTSCSDQHIYGRLKCTEICERDQLSQSHDPLLELVASTDSLSSARTASECLPASKPQLSIGGGSTGKRPRISKPRLLRSSSHSSESHTGHTPKPNSNTPQPAKQSIYLPDSVCHWMTSLRRETHNYRNFVGSAVDANDDAGHPKSIPAKNALIYGTRGSGFNAYTGAPMGFVSNFQNIDNSAGVEKSGKTSACGSVDTSCGSGSGSGRDSNSNNSSACDEMITSRWQQNGDSDEVERQSQQATSPVAQMVANFKRHLLARQTQQQQQGHQQKRTTAGVQLATSAAQNASRLKRQAIYLPIDDNLCNNNNNNNSDNENDGGSESSNDANVNCLRKQPNNSSKSESPSASRSLNTTAVRAQRCAGEQGLASRHAAYGVISSSSKRSGIYERDSEFVNDILSAFETFLQRESQCQKLQSQPVNCSTFEQAYQCYGDNVCLSGAAETIISDPRSATDRSTTVIEPIAAPPSDTCCGCCESLVAIAAATRSATPSGAIEPIFDVFQIINNLLLSRSLNTIVIYFDAPLRVFLHGIHNGNAANRVKYAFWSRDRLVGKYRRFHAYCQLKQQQNAFVQTTIIADPSVKLALVSSVSVSESRSRSLSAGRRAHESVLQRSAKNGSGRESAALLAHRSVKIAVNRVKQSEVGKQPLERSAAVAAASEGAVYKVMKSVDTEKTLKVSKEPKSVCGATTLTKIPAVNAESVDKSQVPVTLNAASFKPQNELETSPKCVSASPEHLRRPEVPTRDPKTVLTSSARCSPPLPPVPAAKREAHMASVFVNPNEMTVPTANSNPPHAVSNSNSNNNHNSSNNNNSSSNRNATAQKQNADEEDIYQPIWKFKTVGEVPERYHTDADYYDVDSTEAAAVAIATNSMLMDDSSPVPSIIICNDVEDHNEWETDDEFMFATQLDCDAAVDECSLNSSTVRSTHSGSSATGSTITGFGSSTATLASAISASLTHHLFRNIGVFYSLSESKLRAIIYDYDRVYSSVYFAKQQLPAQSQHSQLSTSECRSNDSGIGKSPKERSPIPPPRTTSAAKTKGNPPATTGESDCHTAKAVTTPPKPQLLPDSVQAWKFMLLDVNYVEDEEDMIVAEAEILRAQQIKEDNDIQQTRQLNILQRFKSASISNLIDLPNEDDKKSIGERMRNKLSRGVFRLNVRSPKSEKKNRSIFRRTEATSLYLEDGVKPKFPIFGAPLDQLELNQSSHPNVPRFVVDCVEYIERKDCIDQDGLYRASGNKVAVDELKQKLCETYFYDPKLLVTNDIHTLTSLLKQFFRELGAPLIPQETYERLGPKLSDASALATMRQAFEEMREPNRSTLKFLIKHLTNVAAYSSENRMPASNLAIVWGPCILSVNQIEFDIGRMNTFAKILIENYARIFNENERLVS